MNLVENSTSHGMRYEWCEMRLLFEEVKIIFEAWADEGEVWEREMRPF